MKTKYHIRKIFVYFKGENANKIEIMKKMVFNSLQYKTGIGNYKIRCSFNFILVF